MPRGRDSRSLGTVFSSIGALRVLCLEDGRSFGFGIDSEGSNECGRHDNRALARVNKE